MRHKGERHIPDFSSKPKTPHAPSPEREARRPTSTSRPPAPKPQATSAKSGRRGQ